MAALAAAAFVLWGAAASAQDQSLSGKARDLRIADLVLEAAQGRTVALPANAAALDAALVLRDYTGLHSQMGAGASIEAYQMLNWAGVPLVRMVALTTAARNLDVPFERVL